MKNVKSYYEPFLGGGSVLLDILQNHKIKEIHVSDINIDLVNLYITVKNNINDLLLELNKLDSLFNLDQNIERRKKIFYEIREKFNNENNNIIVKSSYFIFLNKTCFNGLYRVNSNGKFNVPMGSYKNPLICDRKNLIEVSKILKDINIECLDFSKSIDKADKDSFVYVDPPYRSVTKDGFTQYQKQNFNDCSQKHLANTLKRLHERGGKFLLSNSDQKNLDINDSFFDDLYSEFRIERVKSRRSINSSGTGRGKINELLIYNY